MDRNRVIGRGNRLPWHLPADLRHFKTLTVGRPIIMGRRTFTSIGRPLPGRTNIVVSRTEGYVAPGCRMAGSLEEAIDMGAAAPGGDHEVMIIGGTSLFAGALPLAGRMHLTLIDHAFEGDTYFPAFDASAWHEVQRRDYAPDDANPYAYSFVDLERTRP